MFSFCCVAPIAFVNFMVFMYFVDIYVCFL